MVTELLCNSSGGPEVVTSKGFDEAKLGVAPEQWQTFLELVAEAATLWPTKHHRDLVVKICEKSKVEICHGLEGVDVPTEDLLAAPSGPAFSMAGQCPFSGQTGAGRCPFSGKTGGQCPIGSSQTSTVSVAAPPPPPAPPLPLACAAGATVLEGSSSPADVPQQPMAGRLLGNSFQRRLDELTEEDPDLCCPISLMVFANPVVASDGFIYEEAMLKQLLANRQNSPMTRESLRNQMRAAPAKKAETDNFRRQRSHQLILFAQEAAQDQPQLALTALDRATDYLNVIEEKPQDLAAQAVRLHVMLRSPPPEAQSQCMMS